MVGVGFRVRGGPSCGHSLSSSRGLCQNWDPPKRTIHLKEYHMGGCQNYDPFLGTLNIRCRIIIGIQKRTIILTTTHIGTLVGIHAPTLQLKHLQEWRFSFWALALKP